MVDKRELYDKFIGNLQTLVLKNKRMNSFFIDNPFEHVCAINGFTMNFVKPIKRDDLIKAKDYVYNSLLPKQIKDLFKPSVKMDGVIGSIEFLIDEKQTENKLKKICKEWKKKYPNLTDPRKINEALWELSTKCWYNSDLLWEMKVKEIAKTITGVNI